MNHEKHEILEKILFEKGIFSSHRNVASAYLVIGDCVQ